MFLYDISTVSFWVEHKGAWYVAMLIPVYLIFPWFYDWAERSYRELKVLGSLTGVFIFSCICYVYSKNLYIHLAQVFNSIIVYLIAYYYASLGEKIKYKEIILGSACTILFIVEKGLPIRIDILSGIVRSLLGIPLVFILSDLFLLININVINKIFHFCGRYSLEMYLWNIFILQAVKYCDLITSMENRIYGYLLYAGVIFIGSLLSVLFGNMLEIILKYYRSLQKISKI